MPLLKREVKTKKSKEGKGVGNQIKTDFVNQEEIKKKWKQKRSLKYKQKGDSEESSNHKQTRIWVPGRP